MKRIDFENGTVTGNILAATLPMLVAQILNLLYNIVDRVYIARIPEVGTAALGAVGLCFPLIVIITAFANLFGSGGAPLFSKLATTSSTGGLSLALQRAIVTARPKGRYRKHFYWPAIKRYYWNLLFSIPLLAHLYISELLHLLYCRLFQHNIL